MSGSYVREQAEHPVTQQHSRIVHFRCPVDGVPYRLKESATLASYDVMRRRNRWLVVVAAVIASGAFVAGYALLFGGDHAPEQAPVIECRTGPTTPGIDVSYYQETIRWKQVRQAGVLFAFIRVADGSTFPDPRFDENWAGAQKVGILRGAYQYFRPDESATAQADVVIRALQHDRGELPPVIDVEYDAGMSPARLARAIAAWIVRVRERVGVEPIIYTGPDFWKTKVGGADLTSQPLWLAHYTTVCPTVPAPWTAWTFWQHTDKGVVHGIDGPVDMDVFAGTYTDLEDFARRSRRLHAARAVEPAR
jgi:lysozyme